VWALLVSAAIAFAATNIDDLFLLVGFFSDPAYRAREVVAGQFAGIAVLVAVSLLCARVALVIPPRFVGLLGVVPIAIGAGRLWSAWRARQAGADGGASGDAGALADPALANPGSRAGFVRTRSAQAIAVTAVTIANGGEDLGVYTPMFAISTRAGVALIVIAFAAMTAIWCTTACYLVRHPRLGVPIRRWGRLLLPFVLIALGLYILHAGGSFALMRSA